MTQTRQFFDAYAHDFDDLYGAPKNLFNSIVNPIFRKSMHLRYQKTLEYAKPIEGRSVLDIGCGPGHYSVALAKAGASRVVGIDFADEMIRIAKHRAEVENVADRCQFLVADILEYQPDQKFDYAVLMGFMDYIADAQALIKKVVSMTSDRLFFSFPLDDGLLAAQRKWRYRNRCPLYMYKEKDLHELFAGFAPMAYKMERISRDFFVTLFVKNP